MSRDTKGGFNYQVEAKRIVACRICGDEIMEDEDFELCPDCLSTFHKYCWKSNGGCGNNECKSFVSKKKSTASAIDKVVLALVKMGNDFLTGKRFKEALVTFEKAISYDPENNEALLGALLAECNSTFLSDIGNKAVEIEKSQYYKRVMELCSNDTREKLSLILEQHSILEQILKMENELQKLYEAKRKNEDRQRKLGIGVKDVRLKVDGAGSGKFAVCGLDDDSMKSVEIPDKINGKPVVEIPDKINGKPVVVIGSYAFENCYELESVKIPDSVREIRSFAFSACESLESIVLPIGLTTIESRAFSKCTNLKKIIIPKGVTFVGAWAFFGCESLTIYCEAESKPDSWDEDWNPSRRPVVWGHKGVNSQHVRPTK